MKIKSVFGMFKNEIGNYGLGCFCNRITENASGLGIQFKYLINCFLKLIFCDPQPAYYFIIMPF